jgi:hypothetical protein
VKRSSGQIRMHKECQRTTVATTTTMATTPINVATSDVEEGIIEIPLPLEEGVELPLDVFQQIDNNNNDIDDDLLVQTKKLPSSPTKTISTTSSLSSSDDNDAFDQNSAIDHAKSKKWWCTSSNHNRLVILVTIILMGIIISAGVLTSLHLTSRRTPQQQQKLHVQRIGNNNGSPNTIFPLKECQVDCDTDSECTKGLICYQRVTSYENVPGYLGGEEVRRETDYCVRFDAVVELNINSDNQEKEEEMNASEEDEGNGNSHGGDKQPPETTIETSITTTTSDNTNEQQPTPTLHQRPTPIDKFLLSGQSNMVGHTTSSQSLTSNAKYWKRLKSILERGGNHLDTTTMKDKLYNAIYNANYYEYNDNTNEQVATTLTNGIMELYNSSLLNDLDVPLKFGKCSFVEVVDDTNVYNVSQGIVPTVWNANCGHEFGHELLFSRTLELEMDYNATEFEMHKIARGGSGLYEHWYPNHGLHWNLLKDAIEQRRQGEGDWKGFIWHQGSQASWSEQQYGEDRSLTYHGNLTGLVEEVRELMFQNSISWQCKEEIPVVIVQVGFWPGNNALASRTRDAQAKFCDEDPRAVLVKTDDLARFYHYDAASFLIMGNRIAHAYQEALQGDVDCPDRVPSTSPTLESMNPSKSSMEPTVMRLEADWPSLNNTAELV